LAPYTTTHRLHREGLTDEFAEEAHREIQERIFGDWPLYGAGKGYGEHDKWTAAYVFGSIMGRGVLELHERTLIVLGALCALQREPLIRIWTNAALNTGSGEEQIKEIGKLTAHFAGFPASRGSVLIFDDVLEKRREDPEARWV
jgi:alkylhydroperoxidase/carboxymuconolactone decarboxylase family protein YurZ